MLSINRTDIGSNKLKVVSENSELNQPDKTKKLTIASLFSGAGGLELGACKTGLVSKIFSTDSNEVFLSTVAKNIVSHFPVVKHQHLKIDSRDLDGNRICELVGDVPHIVVGGPPCDDYTAFGRRRGLSGDKGPLIFDFLRLVNETKAPCFVFENVPNLNQQFSDIFQNFLSAARDLGYCCKSQVLEARHFGAPTLRKRIFVVGWKSKEKYEKFRFPEALYSDPSELPLMNSGSLSAKKFVFISDVLHDLPDVKTPEAERYLNHVGRNHREATIEHLKTVRPGQQIKKSFRYRAPWEGLCQSLMAGLDDSTKSHIHPIYHREMSVREYARIHQFPDTWDFSGTHHNGIKQVANSVPIGLSFAVMNSVINCILDSN